MNIESDHFETLEELMDTIKMWVKNEEEFYDRWFGLNEMNILVNEIERLNNIINKASKKLEATLNCLKDYMFENKEYCKIHTDYIYALEDGIKELKGDDEE